MGEKGWKEGLIEEFLKNKGGIFYTAEEVSKGVQITEFKNAIADYLKDDFSEKHK